MKRFSRRKIALVLACASVLGGKTQAMNKPQSQKTIAAVGGATDKNSNKGFANWAKNHEWQLAVGIGVPVVAAASILAFLGVKYWGKKDNGGNLNKGNNPIENGDIPKDAGNPKEVVKKNNEIINSVIDEAKGGSSGYNLLNGEEGEKQLRANIKKLEDLVLNDKEWFSKNFVEYSQNRFLVQGKKLKIDIAFGYVGYKVAKDWAEVNKLFSFNDKIYGALNDVFSDNIKLSEFFVKNACSFSFGLSDCSIHVSFDEEKNNLEIRYNVITEEKVEICTFSFNMPKGN